MTRGSLRSASKHRVRELWSADRDFNRFPSLQVFNPLIQ